ncbi:MAG: ABC transporter permease [Deltaproteobacteria bacterium]|nr:ABC transporter permease [Candidatus Zymogenaceae bacterium]
MFERIIHIVRKEFRQMFRDRMMRFLIFLPPIMEMLVFGYAASFDVNSIPTAILDEDKTPASRAFVEEFSSNGYFNFTQYLSSPDQIDSLFDRVDVTVCVYVKKGFERSIGSGTAAEVLIVVDGTDSSNASVVVGYITRIVNSYSEDILLERITKFRGVNPTVPISANRVDLIERTWYNEELKSRNFFIPGIIANILTVVGIMMSAMSIVKEREIGTMEQIIVTPISPLELIIGKMIPLVVIAYIDVCLVTAIGTLWFGVPFKGSFIFLFVAVAFFFAANLSFGLLISTVSATQQQAMMNTFLYTFPAMLFSGFAFPIESMPYAIVLITYANPMRYFIELLRGIFIKGMGPTQLWPSLLGLLLISIIALAVSVARFRKRIA